MNILVLAELVGDCVKEASLAALQFAREIEKDREKIRILVSGSGVDKVSSDLKAFGKVVFADDPRLDPPVAERLVPVIKHVVENYGIDTVVGASTSWTKDLAGRVAGSLGCGMAGDVVGHEWQDGELLLKRPMHAGKILSTIKLGGPRQVIMIRGSAYERAGVSDVAGKAEEVDVSLMELPVRTRVVHMESKSGNRPDSTEANVVVSGGRAFKDIESFESMVGGLADKFGGAVGCTRALVDEGITPNDWQIGQTGKIVAPDLYLALGLSGAIQHLAGISNSRIIAAINKDPEAPIFGVANFGLVGDVNEIVPALIEEL